MANLGSLRSLFEKPLPENPSLMESLSSWNHIKQKNPAIDPSSFTELFGELQFEEKPALNMEKPRDQVVPPAASLPVPTCGQNPWFDIYAFDEKTAEDGGGSSLDLLLGVPKGQKSGSNNSGYTLKRSPSLQLCTEGLGSESVHDVDDVLKDGEDDGLDQNRKEEMKLEKQSFLDDCRDDLSSFYSVVRPKSGGFPPPIPSIGATGKPWICFKSCRKDGRFVLREIQIQSQESLLQASREDGRLKLQFVHPDETNKVPEDDVVRS